MLTSVWMRCPLLKDFAESVIAKESKQSVAMLSNISIIKVIEHISHDINNELFASKLFWIIQIPNQFAIQIPTVQLNHFFLGGKNNKRKGAAADEFDDSANFVGVRDRVKGGGGQGGQGGNKNKKFKKAGRK